MKKILLKLKVIQQKNVNGTKNGQVEMNRLNPYNPLSYIVFFVLYTLGILEEIRLCIVDFFVEIGNPFKWR